MQFGLWFEPEMVNPDSDLFREHPDWILSAGDRMPLLHRHQLVLDLSRTEVREHVFEQVSAVLSAYPIDAVKWDHNRDLLEAGSAAVSGAPGRAPADRSASTRSSTRCASAHPGVDWESCASGGGRVDLGVLERVQRVWASDMTDALARQQIQRWTTQLVAPEYVGAHVSSPTSHTTGRTLQPRLPRGDRAVRLLRHRVGPHRGLRGRPRRLGEWVQRYKRFRPLLHSGRVVRPESSDPTVLLHGVVAHDRSEALVAHVQLDEPPHNRGIWVRVPGLDHGGHLRGAVGGSRRAAGR